MRYTTFGRRAGMRFSEHDLGTGNFDLVLATKLAVGASSDRKLSRTGNARKNLRISVEESLARPDTGYIDVLWVHSAERESKPSPPPGAAWCTPDPMRG